MITSNQKVVKYCKGHKIKNLMPIILKLNDVKQSHLGIYEEYTFL